MRLRQGFIESERLSCGLLAQSPSLRRWKLSAARHQAVVISQAAVCDCIIRIILDGQAESLAALLEIIGLCAVGLAASPITAAFNVSIGRRGST